MRIFEFDAIVEDKRRSNSNTDLKALTKYIAKFSQEVDSTDEKVDYPQNSDCYEGGLSK